VDLERWEEGKDTLTPALRAALGSLVEPQDSAPVTAPTATAPAPAATPHSEEPW